MRTLLALAAFALAPLTVPAASSEPAAKEVPARPAASVADLDWLMGDWGGTGLEGHPAGESFSRVGSDRMVGHFWQLDASGGVRFYELITIEPDGESLVMRLKHFNADLTGWEAKEGSAALNFPLRARASGKWVFGPVTFTQDDPDRLKVQVIMRRNADGSASTLDFDYTRLPPR